MHMCYTTNSNLNYIGVITQSNCFSFYLQICHYRFSNPIAAMLVPRPRVYLSAYLCMRGTANILAFWPTSLSSSLDSSISISMQVQKRSSSELSSWKLEDWPSNRFWSRSKSSRIRKCTSDWAQQQQETQKVRLGLASGNDVIIGARVQIWFYCLPCSFFSICCLLL